MRTNPAVADRKSFDLYLRLGERRFLWTNPNHGVTLTDDSIVWVTGGRERAARLHDIAEVNLQTGAVGGDTIATCRLRFSDGSTLSIVSSNRHGSQDDGQSKLYAEFAQDLHARLAALKDAPIAFTAGYGEARYRVGKVLTVIAGLFLTITPTLLLLTTGEWTMGWTPYSGVCLMWPLYRAMKANARRSYDPRDIPQQLVRIQ